MNFMTQKQIEDLALKAGFTAANAKIAAAIAMCEAPARQDGVNGADFDSVGDKELANATWGNSYGAFQVRSLRADKGTGRIRDELRLADPEFNTRSARAIKLQQGWRAWTTYQTGQYKAYMQDVFPPKPGTYIVVSGDSLSKVAAKHDFAFTWLALAQANKLTSPYALQIGQELTLP